MSDFFHFIGLLTPAARRVQGVEVLRTYKSYLRTRFYPLVHRPDH